MYRVVGQLQKTIIDILRVQKYQMRSFDKKPLMVKPIRGSAYYL